VIVGSGLGGGAKIIMPGVMAVSRVPVVRGQVMATLLCRCLAFGARFVGKVEIPRFIALDQRGKVRLQSLRTGHIRFDEINQGFDRPSEGSVLRRMQWPHV
jgi:Zn-dependent alcohol dehydrogenase